VSSRQRREVFQSSQNCVDLFSLIRGISLGSDDIACHNGYDSFHCTIPIHTPDRVYLYLTPYIGCIFLSTPKSWVGMAHGSKADVTGSLEKLFQIKQRVHGFIVYSDFEVEMRA
jgi:hypothetical protein